MRFWSYRFAFLWLLCFEVLNVHGLLGGVFDLRYWRCVLKKTFECPDNDIKFYMYTPSEEGEKPSPKRQQKLIRTDNKNLPVQKESGKKRLRIDINNWDFLPFSGFEPSRKNVFIIHGFNGTESKTPITILRNAYLSRGDYNIFTIDWSALCHFPCYLSALSNTRLVGQCTAKLYAFVMEHGGMADETSCVGHSLGAHICGMVSNHLDVKQHTIIGLDPARPLIDRYGDKYFRLTKDDAHHVQIIHTNAGFLGEVDDKHGHVNFCVNGGAIQPNCRGNVVRVARCSHFQSACYFAKTVIHPDSIIGLPCKPNCPKRSQNWGMLPGKSIPMGHNTPYGVRGSYCVETDTKKDCPFN